MTMKAVVFPVLLLCVLLGVISVDANLRRTSTAAVSRRGAHFHGGSFVKALEFKHRLRVCNAYPYSTALELFRGKNEKLTEAPLAYKACEDFKAPLKTGDKLEFRVGDANAGSFSVSDLPNNDATLLLVISRHDTLSTAVSFESHVFANLKNAQVAVLDTYKGPEKAGVMIQDAAEAKTARSEELRYDSVVAVNPGKYNCKLLGKDGKEKAMASLVALEGESYVVIRSGVEAQQGPSYKEDLIVYPQSDPASLSNSLPSFQVSKFGALISLFAVLLTNLS